MRVVLGKPTRRVKATRNASSTSNGNGHERRLNNKHHNWDDIGERRKYKSKINSNDSNVCGKYKGNKNHKRRYGRRHEKQSSLIIKEQINKMTENIPHLAKHAIHAVSEAESSTTGESTTFILDIATNPSFLCDRKGLVTALTHFQEVQTLNGQF